MHQARPIIWCLESKEVHQVQYGIGHMTPPEVDVEVVTEEDPPPEVVMEVVTEVVTEEDPPWMDQLGYPPPLWMDQPAGVM